MRVFFNDIYAVPDTSFVPTKLTILLRNLHHCIAYKSQAYMVSSHYITMGKNYKFITRQVIIIIVYYAKWQHRKKYNYIHKIQKYIHKTEHKTGYKLKLQFILY